MARLMVTMALGSSRVSNQEPNRHPSNSPLAVAKQFCRPLPFRPFIVDLDSTGALRESPLGETRAGMWVFDDFVSQSRQSPRHPFRYFLCDYRFQETMRCQSEGAT